MLVAKGWQGEVWVWLWTEWLALSTWLAGCCLSVYLSVQVKLLYFNERGVINKMNAVDIERRKFLGRGTGAFADLHPISFRTITTPTSAGRKVPLNLSNLLE